MGDVCVMLARRCSHTIVCCASARVASLVFPRPCREIVENMAPSSRRSQALLLRLFRVEIVCCGGGDVLRYARLPMLTCGCMLRFGSLRKPCLSPPLPRNCLPAGVSLKSLTTLKSLLSLIPLLLSRKPCFCGSFGWKFCCCWSFNDLKVLKDFKDPKVSDVLLRIASSTVLKLVFLHLVYRPPISGQPAVKTVLACRLVLPNRLCRVSVTPPLGCRNRAPCPVGIIGYRYAVTRLQADMASI